MLLISCQSIILPSELTVWRSFLAGSWLLALVTGPIKVEEACILKISYYY
jgi:hypothetical protein